MTGLATDTLPRGAVWDAGTGGFPHFQRYQLRADVDSAQQLVTGVLVPDGGFVVMDFGPVSVRLSVDDWHEIKALQGHTPVTTTVIRCDSCGVLCLPEETRSHHCPEGAVYSPEGW